MRGIRRHVREPKAAELVVARERVQARIVPAEHFQKPQPDRIRVDVQARLGRYRAGAGHGGRERARVPQHPGLKAALELSKRGHVPDARDRDAPPADSASDRACASSSSSTSRGGMSSSRSIMVETGPRRATASTYRSHTGSGTG